MEFVKVIPQVTVGLKPGCGSILQFTDSNNVDNDDDDDDNDDDDDESTWKLNGAWNISVAS